MREQRDRYQRRSGPSKQTRHWIREETPCPSKASRYVATAQHRDALHCKRAGEEYREENQYDSRQLALERD
jgi:hypothetical protein